MPGVPTSRACDACRKQKKKCSQDQPACSRCLRLGIPCAGSGLIRYKFKDHFFKPNAVAARPADLDPIPIASQSMMCPAVRDSQALARSGAFVSLLAIRDPRYDLLSYGLFLSHIPRRIGANEALDAAVDVVVCSYPYLRTRQAPARDLWLGKYVAALQALRRCLGDAQRVTDSGTLCAIYLLMICQGWTGTDGDQKTTHGEGLALLLDATIARGHLDDFESLMRDTLYVPVLLEAVFNPKLRRGKWYLEHQQKALLHSASFAGPFLELVKVPVFITNPARHAPAIRSVYAQILHAMPDQKLLEQRFSSPANPPSPYEHAKLHLRELIPWAMLLFLGSVYNALLRAMDSADEGLSREAVSMAAETVGLADRAARYRPVGAGFLPLCLIPVWAGLGGERGNGDERGRNVREGVERVMEMYTRDFSEAAGRAWRWLAEWFRGEIESLRRTGGMPGREEM